MDDGSNEGIKQKENLMDNTIPFGIACFHFGIAKEPPFRYTKEQYIAELHTALESIPNIEQINIIDTYENQILSEDITEKIPDICEAEGVFPDLGIGEIKFSIHIPDRIQQQIEPTSETCTERFEISINYCLGIPVTFIIPLNPIGECSPSDAVIIVRKFLTQQFMNIKSEYIRFEMLGPSPFHADCYIKPCEDIESDLSSPGFIAKDVTTKAGYDKLIFYYDTEIFENAEDAKACIFHEIILELSFFYEIIQSRSVKIRKWVQIDEMLSDIIPKNRKKSIWNRFLDFINYSGKIKELFIAIAIFERDLIFNQEEMIHSHKEFYSDRWNSYFKNFIDKAVDEGYKYPTKELIQLLGFLEDKREKNMELFTMFVSAIIGGVIGALITLYLTK